MYLFQRFFHGSKHLWKSVFVADRSCCVIFCFMISTSSNLFPYKSSFVLGNTEESHTVQGGENIETAALVWFSVYLIIVARAETLCCGGFASLLMTPISRHLWCTASCRCRRIVYNIPYLLFDLLKRTHDAQHRLHRKKICEQYFCLASNLMIFIWPWGWRSFPNIWLGLCFGIIALDPSSFASDNVSYQVCIWFCALKNVSGFEQVFFLLFGCQYSQKELRYHTSHA
jgi:hypothetical protein